MKRKSGEFNVTDQRGAKHSMIEYLEVLPTGTLGSVGTSEEGRRSYTLADGTSVNRMDDGTFEEVGGRRKFNRI